MGEARAPVPVPVSVSVSVSVSVCVRARARALFHSSGYVQCMPSTCQDAEGEHDCC